MWSCWRTRHSWKVSRSRLTVLSWSIPCLPTHSSRRSSASWWCGCRSYDLLARRRRTTCATCIWVERCPATTYSLRCCMPSERVCKKGSAVVSYFAGWDFVCGRRVNELRELNEDRHVPFGIRWGLLFKLEQEKCCLKPHLHLRWIKVFLFPVLSNYNNMTIIHCNISPCIKNVKLFHSYHTDKK